MSRTPTPACQSDLACYRNDGHAGDHAYATPPSDPAAPLRCDFDCDACRDVDDGWQERGNPFEAEARAALLAELEAGVEGLPSDIWLNEVLGDAVRRAAVLDLIRAQEVPDA